MNGRAQCKAVFNIHVRATLESYLVTGSIFHVALPTHMHAFYKQLHLLANCLGYLKTLRGKRIFHTLVTGCTEAMKSIHFYFSVSLFNCFL